jgi:hypothetical protein
MDGTGSSDGNGWSDADGRGDPDGSGDAADVADDAAEVAGTSGDVAVDAIGVTRGVRAIVGAAAAADPTGTADGLGAAAEGSVTAVGVTAVGVDTPTHETSDAMTSSTAGNRLACRAVTLRPYHRTANHGQVAPRHR